MPDSQDLETFIRVRSHAPAMPIVIVTGLDDIKLAAKAVEAGAQDYLVKTQLSRTSLTRSLRYAIERTRVRDAEWDSPMFRLAQRQFLKAAQLMGLDDNIRQRLLFPQRNAGGHLSLPPGPLRRSRNRLRLPRAAHPDDGPDQRRHPLPPGRQPGRSLRAGHVDDLEVRPRCSLPFGGAKGGVRIDPTGLTSHELQRLTRRYASEIITMIGPDKDIPAPDMGTNERVMAWIMDTYSQQVGYAVPAVVTGKPVVLGGARGRNEATGRGVVYLIEEAAQHLGLNLSRVPRRWFRASATWAATPRDSLTDLGVKVIGVSDVTTGIYNPKGLSVTSLLDVCHARTGSWQAARRAKRSATRSCWNCLATSSCPQHCKIRSRPRTQTASTARSWPKGPTARPRWKPTRS